MYADTAYYKRNIRSYQFWKHREAKLSRLGQEYRSITLIYFLTLIQNFCTWRNTSRHNLHSSTETSWNKSAPWRDRYCKMLSLSLATIAPDEMAYRIMKEPGYTAIMAGEVIHLVKCIPVKCRLRPVENCYN